MPPRSHSRIVLRCCTAISSPRIPQKKLSLRPYQSLLTTRSPKRSIATRSVGLATMTSTNKALTKLFDDVEAKIPGDDVGEETWYLIILVALTSGPAPYPEFASSLYLHLVNRPAYQTSESRQRLVRRLREALVKSVPIVGVCKPLEAIFAIGKVEKDEDKDYSHSREGWQCDEMNLKRGKDWLNKIYQQNLSQPQGWMDAHKDFDWISQRITYGLYLSDRQILNDIETELIVLTGIMTQNLKLETHWHLRGTRRIGVSAENVETIQQCIESIAAFMDIKLDRVPRVKDIESEV